ncbi:MAG: alpha-2-macroglobulin family protein [Hyphomicrobiaceae bacterium]|nr:alpha-2-macroglobulin family protein [Hyphomicrobiaceae bacterium]
MRVLLHLLLSLAFILAAAGPPAMLLQPSLAFAETKPFSHAGLTEDGKRYETYLKSHWKPGKEKPEQLIAAAAKAISKDKDARAAARNLAMAVVAEPGNSGAWTGLAEALLAIKPDPAKGSERFDLPVNASGAAYIAYERATTKQAKARALVVLSDALKRRAFWRPAIEALKTSIALVDNAQVQAALDKLAAEHGFRMTDYRTDSDAASPRVCLQFSEMLSRAPVDFAKFVTVGGKDPAGVSPENKQLCIEGLTHGERYEIQLKAGLPSDVGEVLLKNIDVGVYVPDRKPSVRFTGRSYVLPSRGQQGIPVVSINTDAVKVEAYRIGDRNLAQMLQNGDLDRQLSTWDVETIQNRSGERIYKGVLEVKSKINAEVVTAVPVGDSVGTLKPGAYVMIAKPDRPTGGENEYNVATQWFIVSDLGLTAFSGSDGIHAFVRSLAETKPVGAAKVRVVARNNEVLAEAQSDDKGYVRFPAGIAKGEGGLQPAILVAERGDGSEYAFLDLTTAAFDLSDRGVKGRDAPGPIDAFIFPERGVYRPGETVHLTGLVRDEAGKAVTTPMTLIVSRPDGVEYRRIVVSDAGQGGRSHSMPLSSSAMTGTWRAKLHVDPEGQPIAQVSFLVEDFMPERLDMTLTPPAEALRTDANGTVKLDGRYLYGPPAAGLALEGEIIVKPLAGDLAGFPGYRFGLADETVTPVRAPLEGLGETDAAGHADVAIKLPQIPSTAKPLEAQILLRMKEPGGRGIERSVIAPVAANGPRLGIKSLFEADDLGEDGGQASFEVIHLDAASKRSAVGAVNWQLLRLETNWQWYSRDGSWTYDAVTFTRKVASGTVDIGTDAPASITAPVGYGRYRLEVTTPGENSIQSSVAFNAGWFVSADNPDSPEVLDVALDKSSYSPGDTAKLRIASKHGGTALITVLGSGLMEAREVEIAKGGGEVSLTVGENWGAGAYVTAMLYRPMDEALKRMPGRALGLAWLGIDQKSRTLPIALDAPEKIKGGQTFTVPVTVGNLGAGEQAHLTLAAVDLGVLNVTRYKAPEPQGWFWAQRKLGVDIRDFYGRLIDGMRAERGTMRSGGDGDAGMEMQGSPSVEQIVSLYSGIVTVGADGKANVSFEMPDFNGTVRLMAVAWTAGKLGSSSKDVIVRDAVALTLTSPRFMTLGDEARLTLDVHNVEGPAALYQIAIDMSVAGMEQAPRERVADKAIDLAAGAKKIERITLKPTEVGPLAYEVRLSGPGGIAIARSLTIDVKPPAGDIKRTTVAKLKPNGSLTLSKDLVTDLIQSRTRINLSAGPQARFDIPGLLTQLDRYPYGCAEQTVSRALPLVYANAVATRVGIGTDKALKERVQKAIEHVFSMQDNSGAFGVWGPSTVDLWLTAYVTDFLTRTKEAGYEVRPEAFNRALDRLQNYISYAQDFESGGEDRAYALYVLSRNGRAPMGELRYYVDTRLDRFSSPLAKAQLGAALAMLGDKPRAERAFKAAVEDIDKAATDIPRDDYGSRLRDGAALVTLASESGIAKTDAPRLADVIAKAYAGRGYTSTQEQAWLLLAANALSAEAAQTRLSFDGAPLDGPVLRPLTPAEISKSGGLVIRNDGEAAVDVVVSVIGAALTPEPPVSKGFTITRSYYTLEGKEVVLASANGGTATLAQNDRLVAVVKVETREEGGRVLLVDRLPSGLEIENPRLVASGDVKSIEWLEGTLTAEHAEFRDDRFVAAFNLFPSRGENGESSGTTDAAAKGTVRTATAAYIVRAVTPGKFVHPAATVEDMYRPERYARTAAGTLVISGKE